MISSENSISPYTLLQLKRWWFTLPWRICLHVCWLWQFHVTPIWKFGNYSSFLSINMLDKKLSLHFSPNFLFNTHLKSKSFAKINSETFFFTSYHFILTILKTAVRPDPLLRTRIFTIDLKVRCHPLEW